MPAHLVSPPAVQRVVPVSKPLGTAPVHVSVAAVHGSTSKPVVAATKPVFTPAALLSASPAHVVSQPRTYLQQ